MQPNAVKYRIRNTDYANDYKISIFVVTLTRSKGCVDSQSQVCDTVATEVNVILWLFISVIPTSSHLAPSSNLHKCSEGGIYNWKGMCVVQMQDCHLLGRLIKLQSTWSSWTSALQLCYFCDGKNNQNDLKENEGKYF